MDYQAFTNPFFLFYYYQISNFLVWVLFWGLKQKKLESVFPQEISGIAKMRRNFSKHE
jgi:hypothetical protein